jgi:CheY-like chemotaxis protein
LSFSDRKKILVVEDDPTLRDLYRTSLTIARYSVTAVEDGLDALRRIESDPPDLIVLDMALPRLGGRDVQQELAAHADTRHIPILVVTGSDTRDLNPADFRCILQKPVTPDALVAAVDDCLLRSLPSKPLREIPVVEVQRERRSGLRCPWCGDEGVKWDTITLIWKCSACDAVWPERRKAS